MEIKLVLESLRDREVKLSWAMSNWDPDPYVVDRAMLLLAAEDLRRDLHQLTSYAIDCYRTRTVPDFAASLSAVRESGGVLFNRLFDAEDARDTADAVRAQLQQHMHQVLAGEAEPAQLTIVLRDDAVLLPWAFVFDADAAADAPGGGAVPAGPLTLSAFEGFWLSAFRIRQRITGLDRLPRMPRAMPEFRGLHIVNEQLFTGAMSALQERAAAQRVREVFQRLGRGSLVRDWTATRQEWARIRDVHDSVIFVFGHSDGEMIQLGEAPSEAERRRFSLNSAAFRDLIRKNSASSASICFLNACRTAAPDPRPGGALYSASFLKATRQKGFHGFIGTEAEISNADALLYASEFLFLVYAEGRSIGEAFDALQAREDLLPFNLFYSCFALPEFRIPKPADADAPPQPAELAGGV